MPSRFFILILLLTCNAAAVQAQGRNEVLRTFREEFVAIRPGEAKFPRTFTMGGDLPAESPRHEVSFNYPFSIAKYEVTQNLWRVVMGKNPSRWRGERNSVEMLSFAEAQDFCRRVTLLLREQQLIHADEQVRLPSEAEWEYAARGGTTTKYSFGDEPGKLNDYAWSHQNARGNDPEVGEKRPNPWGLYDVHGYLWEWCRDDGSADYRDAPTDGSPLLQQADQAKGVVRGGSWKDTADRLTSSYRLIVPRSLRDDAVGLRCVLAKVPGQKQISDRAKLVPMPGNPTKD